MIHDPPTTKPAAPRASFEPSTLVFLTAVGGLALAVRIAALLTMYDVPGDGPTRAIEAYQWSRHPWLPTSGVWPPGFLLLHGPANWLVPHPGLTSRLVNVALGTLTIPALFVFARRALGAMPAVVGTVALALWPLHVELSASSLSEAGFVFALVAGLGLLDLGLDPVRSRWRLGAGIGLVVWASMTRYEAWWLLPILPPYLWWRGKRLGAAAIAGGALFAFPAAWLLGNYVGQGDPLAGFAAAMKGAEVQGATAVGLGAAVARIAFVAADDLGWLLTPALAASALVAIVRSPKGRPTGILYAAVLLTFWSAMLYFAHVRGESLYSRYLTLGLVLAFPTICASLQPTSPRARGWVGAALVTAILGAFLGTGRVSSGRWLTHRAPTEIEDVAAWLASGWTKPPIVLATDMSWRASYLAVLRPELADGIFVVSDWMSDEILARVLEDRRPRLLLTSARDQRQLSRIEGHIDASVESLPLLHSAGDVEVRDLAGLPRHPARH